MTAGDSRTGQQGLAQSYVALLRGINIGGKNKLPMKDLTAMFSATGCENVQNYIQSGNVVFHAPPEVVSRLSEEIAAQIEKRFGYRTPVFLRTAGQLEAILRKNPFLPMGAPEESLHVLFLASTPSASEVKTLDPDRSPPDTFLVRKQEIYLRFPNGVARSKLTTGYFDTRLNTVSTLRNWRTVGKLHELATRHL